MHDKVDMTLIYYTYDPVFFSHWLIKIGLVISRSYVKDNNYYLMVYTVANSFVLKIY